MLNSSGKHSPMRPCTFLKGPLIHKVTLDRMGKVRCVFPPVEWVELG